MVWELEMNLEIIEFENTKIAKVPHDTMIHTVQDATDLMGNADYQGARNIILEEKNLNPQFFDLRTGIAGEILQKHSNYHMRIAIIGEFEKYNSNALNAFIVECNRGNNIFFVSDFESAIKKLISSAK